MTEEKLYSTDQVARIAGVNRMMVDTYSRRYELLKSTKKEPLGIRRFTHFWNEEGVWKIFVFCQLIELGISCLQAEEITNNATKNTVTLEIRASQGLRLLIHLDKAEYIFKQRLTKS